MDIKQLNEYGPGSLNQYGPPQNYELIGQTFVFSMDDGIDYTLRFIDKMAVEWNFEGEAPQKAFDYHCVKGDDTTYLVSYELDKTKLRTNHTWVIDLENQLVTRKISVIGDHPKYPFLIRPKYEFGAIKQEGVELKTYPRHGFTTDVVGTVVQWTYGFDTSTVHVYHSSNYYRITYPPEKAGTRVLNEMMAKVPSSDEPARHIKIKEGMYLLTLTEANMEKIIGEGFGVRSDTMVFLQNYKHVYQVGDAWCTVTMNGRVGPLHLSFGAFGKILDPKEEYILKMLTDPNPYII